MLYVVKVPLMWSRTQHYFKVILVVFSVIFFKLRKYPWVIKFLWHKSGNVILLNLSSLALLQLVKMTTYGAASVMKICQSDDTSFSENVWTTFGLTHLKAALPLADIKGMGPPRDQFIFTKYLKSRKSLCKGIRHVIRLDTQDIFYYVFSSKL